MYENDCDVDIYSGGDRNQNNKSDLPSSTNPSRKLKRKRLVKFNENWLEKYPWLKKGKNENFAKCSVCNLVSFS